MSDDEERKEKRDIVEAWKQWKQWKQWKFVVSCPAGPPAVPCWLSLAAALRGVLQSLGSIGCPKET